MSRKKNEEPIKCIAYLSVKDELRNIERAENRQFRYLREYAEAHHIHISQVIRRKGMGQAVVNAQWLSMIAMIRQGIVDGILIAGTEAVSTSVPDSFYKIGQVCEAGGIVVTVDEGRLGLPIRRTIEGRLVLVNERF